MKLRKLEFKDAPLMLEWMHDETVVHNLQANFADKSIVDCEKFIESSCKSEQSDLHLAIVDGNDTYMGTVSLKHINSIESYAEFAITIRKCAMGQGYAQYGMKEIIRIGIEEIGLNQIIWCVSDKNERAVRFYDKMGYKILDRVPDELIETYCELRDLKWYTNKALSTSGDQI